MGELIDFEYGKWTKHYKSPKGVTTIGCNVDLSITENCANPASFGAICIQCNMCGRFDDESEDNNDTD